MVDKEMADMISLWELIHFVNVIKGNDKPLVTGGDGIMALKLALAAVKSYKTGDVQRI